METSYLKMVADTRIRNYLGLRMDEGYEFKRPVSGDSDYAYIDIPIRGILMDDGSIVREAKRNQSIYLVPACEVQVRGKGIRFEIHPNPKFWEFGACQGMYYLEPGSGPTVPGFNVVLRKDINLDEFLDDVYCIRIYMRQ